MNTNRLTIVKYIFEIILIIILSLMYYLNKPIITPKVLYIQKGSITKIIAQLHNQYNEISKLDAFILRLIGSPQSGWIDMNTEHNTKADFLYKLTHAKAALRSVTLIPGETTYIFLRQLSKTLNLSIIKLEYEFYKQTPFKEGAIVPNTYSIPLGISEKDLISLLLDASSRQMTNMSIKIFGTFNEIKWLRYLSIASVIQKESANIKEMPIVSSVIYNRIRKGMKLQMDGTLNYGKYSHIKITPQRIRGDKSIYNTYLHKGIPSLPICNVSLYAIKAAIFPATTNYLYFMKNSDNVHDFACNYSTHILNIKRVTKRNNKLK